MSDTKKKCVVCGISATRRVCEKDICDKDQCYDVVDEALAEHLRRS